MASAREHLQSIFAGFARLQNEADQDLEQVREELKEVDNIVTNINDVMYGEAEE